MGMSKSLMLEVRGHGVRVTAVCPGSVDTPFFDKAGRVPEHPDRLLTPDDVARAITDCLALGPQALISELDIRPANP